ncbi:MULTISPECIES: FadR/GntR family transcriptional regulator [Actinomycetes]|uniref:FadR/GntR family transcriptional regulator n=1 Tax=Actinomycetes TaxID=1760 RepID=UPI0001B5656F|nr:MULTISPECIES: FCD domain-containing protein [Actinomycetes]
MARWLIAYLQRGELRPGDRLPPERKLAEMFGVRRAKLREAINPLEVLGLLDRRVGDGTYFASTSSELLPETVQWGLMLDAHNAGQMLEACCHLAVDVAGLAAARRSAEELARLHGFHAAMTEAAEDPDRFARASSAFHQQIAKAGGNEVLAGVLSSIQSLLRARIARVEDARESMGEYGLLVKAIDASDIASARAAMAAHVERVAARIRAEEAGD